MKVLFVKLGAIGDAVMALSLVPALESAHPGAKLTWMCGRGIEPLLRLFPQIHELIVVDERTLFGKSKVKALGELLGLQKRLLGRRFDLVLHGNVDWRYRLLTAAVRAGETRGWSRSKARPWPIPGRYHGDEYARLVAAESPETRHWVPPAPKLEISAALRETVAGPGRLIVLAPGGAKNILADSSLRRWPLENYVALAQELVQRGFRIALTGGETDRWVQPAFEKIPHLDLIGRTSLPDLLGVYTLAAAVVSHDTSSVHLPRLVGTPVVALFGPTTPSQFFPANAKGRVIWGGEHLACRPCYDGRNYSVCRKNNCMISIAVTQVLGAVDTLCGNGADDAPRLAPTSFDGQSMRARPLAGSARPFHS
jgi:heptosyltransferase II